MQMNPNRIVVDLIGKFFIIPPFLLNLKKKDARVDTEHPPLRVLLLQMRHPHIRLFQSVCFDCRANRVCSGT